MTENGVTLPQDPAAAGSEALSKGKGKALSSDQPMDTTMDQDDDDDDEEEEEEEVCSASRRLILHCL